MSAGYLLALFGGMAGALAAFWMLLLGLRGTDNLPPPAFSNSLCVDEKLSFLRENPIESPDLLVIGSSVAWRHIDGDAIVRHSPGTRPLNGAFCGLHANQSVYVANWLLDREPTVRHVLMVVDPQDFAGCWRVSAAVFNRNDVDQYVYEKTSPWLYYMHYFSPGSLMRNALKVKDQRANRIEFDPLVFNRYGDGPLNTVNSRELLYGRPEALDSTCFNALQTLATRLYQEGRQLTVVSTPLHPDWKAQQDPTGVFLANFDQQLATALAPTKAQYWNGDKEWITAKTSFIDAIHLRWSAAQKFSEAMVQEIRIARNDVAPGT
ncbi:hypothetical protein JQR86_21300 (plasmid) [Pseudomonas sp. JZ134]|uniref:SGNH/GDSL hydrolase family protein n=1 Tax=Pseudomonas luteola TaxID=47886 RepID=A0ABS0FR58_PSELU|nr:hypothetical protein [Pseudomonas zeshuii]MBF8642801.1 hypothetical protein [Pseudomonas zeshuii]MBW5413636.1 hypothetical protein [Pseudomonas sp. MAG002Y]QEU27574.1 hypothetical protein FOB45_03035 [Pseudomonas luteola]RRW44664.1 hypothetical protein EGJ50_16715 [Pseudomonas luteola]